MPIRVFAPLTCDPVLRLARTHAHARAASSAYLKGPSRSILEPIVTAVIALTQNLKQDRSVAKRERERDVTVMGNRGNRKYTMITSSSETLHETDHEIDTERRPRNDLDAARCVRSLIHSLACAL